LLRQSQYLGLRVVCITGHHATLAHAAQPGDLTFGQLAGRKNSLVAQFTQGELTIQAGPGLAIANAAHGGQVGAQVAARAQGHHLVEQSGGQHGIKALRNPLVQPTAILWLKGDQQRRIMAFN